MAHDIGVRGPSATHRQTCMLHGDDRASVCSGSLRRGGKCVRKASGPEDPHMMPTCKLHRDQLKVLGWCQARLTCGFECGRIYEWKPHGFPLCLAHRQFQTACYILRIPTELRFRIYGYLLPDGPVPARHGLRGNLRSDGERVHLEILRVNHQVHDEAADLLYGARAFTIELSNSYLSMCNSSKFCLAARPQQIATAGDGFAPTTGINVPVTHATRPMEPIWEPPLSARYFNMIQSFVVEIWYTGQQLQQPLQQQLLQQQQLQQQLQQQRLQQLQQQRLQQLQLQQRRQPLPQQQLQQLQQQQQIMVHLQQNASASFNAQDAVRMDLEPRLYDHCDYVHMLIERLRHIPTAIAQLKIMIKFNVASGQPVDTFAAAKLLLKPFKRLRNVTSTELLSITKRYFNNADEIDLLKPDSISCEVNEGFSEFLKCWNIDMSSFQPSPKSVQVFKAYWRIENVISDIKKHHHSSDFTFLRSDHAFHKFAKLLHAARVAREFDDLESLKDIWEQVVDIWFDYLNDQKDYQSNVEGQVDAIYDLLGGRSLSGLESGSEN